MDYIRHRFDHPEQYLHHRAPYLFVDEITEIDSTCVKTIKRLNDEFVFAAHFPGAPIFPGALMQEMNTQSAGIWLAAERNPMESFDTSDPNHNEFALGVLIQVNRARYRRFGRPGDELACTVGLVAELESVFDFKGEITCRGEQLMQIQFRLANVPSQMLLGETAT